MFQNDQVVAILCGALLDTSLSSEDTEVRVSKEETEAGSHPGGWGVQIDAEADDDFYVLKRIQLKEEGHERDGDS